MTMMIITYMLIESILYAQYPETGAEDQPPLSAHSLLELSPYGMILDLLLLISINVNQKTTSQTRLLSTFGAFSLESGLLSS